MIYLQGQNGLPQDGIVGDATWAVLEGGSSPSSPSTPGAPTTLRMRPLDLTVPWSLRIDWQETTLQQLSLDLGNFSVHSTPNTQFKFLNPVGKLFGAGGIEVLHREVQSWPNWFVDWSTKATIDWSKTAGLRIGDDNHVTFGLRPLRGVSVTPRATSISSGNRCRAPAASHHRVACTSSSTSCSCSRSRSAEWRPVRLSVMSRSCSSSPSTPVW